MSKQQIKNADSQPQTDAKSLKEQPARRSWVKPTFERVSIKEAMSGTSHVRLDTGFSYS